MSLQEAPGPRSFHHRCLWPRTHSQHDVFSLPSRRHSYCIYVTRLRSNYILRIFLRCFVRNQCFYFFHTYIRSSFLSLSLLFFTIVVFFTSIFIGVFRSIIGSICALLVAITKSRDSSRIFPARRSRSRAQSSRRHSLTSGRRRSWPRRSLSSRTSAPPVQGGFQSTPSPPFSSKHLHFISNPHFKQVFAISDSSLVGNS